MKWKISRRGEVIADVPLGKVLLMNDSDITKIEKVTECALPIGYRNLLLNFPPTLKALLNADPKDERLLFTDAPTIVRWNKFFRSPNYEYENSYGEICKFPRHHIVIGANLGGDFYHLSIKRKQTTVFCWRHDDGEFEACDKNLAAYVRSIYKGAATLAIDGLDLSRT